MLYGFEALGMLKGKTILAFIPAEERKDHMYDEKAFLLADDGKTVVEFHEQDYYSYHDCSTSARECEVYENSVIWKAVIKLQGERDAR